MPRSAASRLAARPAAPAAHAGAGTQPLGVAQGRDGLLHLPPQVDGTPLPLVVLLHGAGGGAHDVLPVLRPLADHRRLALLAPDSRGPTWDVLLGGFGRDVAYLDAALAAAFARVPVDPARVAVAGFSDGASYALGLGLANGDLFGTVLAFSPGFVAPVPAVGCPRCYVSHGRRDDVLPIDACSRRLVPQLRAAGHVVRYEEFAGGHTVPAAIARAALDWFLDPDAEPPLADDDAAGALRVRRGVR